MALEGSRHPARRSVENARYFKTISIVPEKLLEAAQGLGLKRLRKPPKFGRHPMANPSRMQALPIEALAGIDLAPRRHVGMGQHMAGAG